MGSVLKTKALHKVLHQLYYNPKSSASFSGIQKLLHAVRRKKQFVKVKQKEIEAWLKQQPTYTLHKPFRKHFTRRKTIVSKIDQQWQADLADMQSLMKQNNMNRYLLCVIDVFSRFAWVIPIKNKMGKTLIQAFESIFKTSKRKPLSLQTDKGTEFKNHAFQMYLKKQNIHFFTTENPETKASIVERFQRTLKTRMWKYFTFKKTRKYIDVLDLLVQGYNQSFHRSIKSKPSDVRVSNESEISQHLYSASTSKRIKFAVHDLVRINKTKRTFDKGYLPNWTTELFKIVRINKTHQPVTYTLEDLDGERIQGTFYDHEIQSIKDNDIYDIESVLDRRTRRVGNKHIKEIKVHWAGYPSKFDSWIPESHLV